MPLKRLALCSSLILVLGWGGMAQAQYLLTGNSGGQMQIGTGLPLPVASGIFQGGKTPGTAGTFPPLLIPPNPDISTAGTPTRTIMQNMSTTMGGAVVVPPNALSKGGWTQQVKIGMFTTNPAVYQVATSLSWRWPNATATLAPGAGPGPGVYNAAGGTISYSGGAQSFGGAAVFAINAGPNAGTYRIPPNGLGVAPIASVWINVFGKLPATAMTLGVMGASNPAGQAQPGQSTGAPPNVTAFGPANPGYGAVNLTTPIVCCTVGPNGTVSSSFAAGATGLSNMVTSSKGFPWTTGFITVSQPSAAPPEIFYASGTDTRVAGVGNISLVSGALSLRALSGPNANRGWISLNLVLPEPTVALGAAGALAMLGLCHGLVRRRSR